MVGPYRFGSVQIDGETYDGDLIYYGGQITRWWRQKGHKVKVADIEELIAKSPEVIVFGTGAMGMMQIGRKALAALEGAGIGVVARRTADAIERYNQLIAAGHDAALAIHLTC